MAQTKEQRDARRREATRLRAATKKQLRIWIEPDEYDAIKAAADAAGTTLAGYILPRVLPDPTGHTGRGSHRPHRQRITPAAPADNTNDSNNT